MRDLLLVAGVRFASLRAGLRRWDGASVLKAAATLIIFGGFALGVFGIARAFGQYLMHDARIGHFLFHRFLSMLLYVFFVTVHLGNMIVAYATLYRSGEVHFLMSLPLSHQKIFLIRFLDNFFASSATLTILGVAALAGYGTVFHLPWWFLLLTALVVMLPFMMIAGILAVSMLMALIAAAARIGVRPLLGMLLAGYAGAIYVYFRITNPGALVAEVMRHYPNVDAYFGYLDPPLVRYLPSHWVTEFLYWSVYGDFGRALPYFTLLFLTAVALVILAAAAARRFYYATWTAAQDAEALRAPRTPLRLGWMEFGRGWGISPPLEALVKRDFWMFLRDPGQWLHFILMLLVAVIFVVSAGSLNVKPGPPVMQAATILVVFLFIGFLIASITLRFVFPASSLEGESFWCVRTSPFPLRRLYWQKTAGSLVWVTALGGALAVSSLWMMRGDGVIAAVGGAFAVCAALALTGLNLGAGTWFALYREKNPVRVASSQGASLTFLAGMLYLVLAAGMLLIPLQRYFERAQGPGGADPWLFAGPLAAVGMISALVFWGGTGAGLRALGRDV
ncbi:MAG: hypothetical protein WB626_05560 [Bacteroidota bacterium]